MADALVLGYVERSGTPAFAAINKVDLMREKTAILPVIDRLARMRAFAEILPISALKRDGIERRSGKPSSHACRNTPTSFRPAS